MERYTTITNKRGVWTATTTHATRAEAREAARAQIAAGTADYGTIWDGYGPIERVDGR